MLLTRVRDKEEGELSLKLGVIVVHFAKNVNLILNYGGILSLSGLASIILRKGVKELEKQFRELESRGLLKIERREKRIYNAELTVAGGGKMFLDGEIRCACFWK